MRSIVAQGEGTDLLRDDGVLGQLEALARGAHRLPRGALLFEQGQDAEFLHVLLDGAVALSAACDGRHATIVELVQPVDYIGLGPAIDGQPHPLTARTVQPSRLLSITAEELRRRVADEPGLAAAMLGRLATRNRRLVGQIKDLKLRTGTERLGCWLLRLVDEQGHREMARLSVPKGILAQLLGMTAESLSRALATLRLHGVEVRGSQVSIVDRARLEALCRLDVTTAG